jgi:hydrogenase expression/formation protein HypE
VILINGYIGDHGAAVLDARGELALESTIETDCQPLNGLVRAMLDVCPDIHCLRDGTRGGVATVLNEFAEVARCCMRLNEDALLLREEVRGMCELLGLDPLYLANEGKLVAIIPAENAQQVLTAMRAHPAGKDSVVIGEVTAKPEAVVVLQTVFGGQRIVDMLTGEQLPRIC